MSPLILALMLSATGSDSADINVTLTVLTTNTISIDIQPTGLKDVYLVDVENVLSGQSKKRTFLTVGNMNGMKVYGLRISAPKGLHVFDYPTQVPRKYAKLLRRVR